MKKSPYISLAQISFEKSSWDIYHLFDIHDELISDIQVLKKREKADVLLRSTYLFITAYWESYIEDLCEEAHSELLKETIKERNWAENVMEMHRKKLIQNFNTPKSSNINNLYSEIIGLCNLTDSWQWSGITAQQSQEKLGTDIKIRGEIAHRSRTTSALTRKKSEEYLDFIKILVIKTDSIVQNYVKSITGTYFGKNKEELTWLEMKK